MATASEVLKVGEALAGENEAVVGQNNTTINKHYNWPGAPYCGLFIRYCMEMAGCKLLAGCANVAFVPTLRQFMDAQGWRVANSAAKAGDIVVEGNDQHVVFVHKVLGNGTVIFLEGNGGHVKATEAQAENGTGSTFEGIGYRRQVLGSNHRVYRPPYDGSSGSSGTKPEEHPNSVGAACTVNLALCRSGSKGPMVKTIQRVLYSYGYKGADGKPVAVDGEYGANTVYAVKNMQRKLGLSQDGIVGKDTWSAMLTGLW